MTQEEKYISIEYDVWKNKYLPMEEENKDLKEQLKDKVIHIQFRTSETQNYRIGYAVFLNDAWNIHIDDRHELDLAIETELRRRHETEAGHPLGHYYRTAKYLTEDDAKSIDDKLSRKKAEIDRRETYLWKLEMKLRKIPFFIRWIFNIHFN